MLGHVRKPIRELRKSLRHLASRPPEKVIHNLRTRSRSLEAIAAALALRDEDSAQPLLKAIKPLRKAAGDVRDMDVLEAKVRFLLRSNPDAALERLLEHLKTARDKSAQELAEKLAGKKKAVRHGLKQLSRYVAKHADDVHPDPNRAHELFDALCRWPRLNAGNLHEFRITLKELRYMLQLMEGPNAAFMRALENAKTRIGVWHDWEELRLIAAELLDSSRDRNANAAIAKMEEKKFRMAMRAAQSLRTCYLKASVTLSEVGEP